MNEDIGTKLRRFVTKEILLEDGTKLIAEDTQLVGGVLDSLGLMQLVSYIRDEFGVTFEDAEVTPEGFRTTATVADLVEGKLRTLRTA